SRAGTTMWSPRTSFTVVRYCSCVRRSVVGGEGTISTSDISGGSAPASAPDPGLAPLFLAQLTTPDRVAISSHSLILRMVDGLPGLLPHLFESVLFTDARRSPQIALCDRWPRASAPV